jgi:alginate O-acetyltransferase complex protein AlgI
MLFNSLEFGLFLPIVYLTYWGLKGSLKIQNFILLVASYVFYAWWDWRFLSLIIASSALDYTLGRALGVAQNQRTRKLLLAISVAANLGLLGLFKYYNFFIDQFSEAFTLIGSDFQPNRLNIILPVGISFYTFQTLSYTIDVYRNKLTPTKNVVAFFTFVAFFPQLVAGPIERASNLLPQFFIGRNRGYQSTVDGLKRILWGLFQKVVIADNCAEYVNIIFSDYAQQSSGMLAVGAILFSLQIYGDFSGYSEIAIGTARLFGFKLMDNFAFPYFSRDIAEFWRRWHISLSSWFRDYLYIPLGGSRGGLGNKIRNTFIIFLVSGFWHGANWTFIVWGGLNSLFFIPLLLLNRNRSNLEIVASGRVFPRISDVFAILQTYVLTCFAWIFFRSENVGHAVAYISSLFSLQQGTSDLEIPTGFTLILVSFVVMEWLFRSEDFVLSFRRSKPHPFVKWSVYLIISIAIASFFGTRNDFIYFQF